MDSELAAVSSISATLDPEPVVRPRKDFGVLPVPARLRYDPGRQLGLGWWTQIGLSLGCTFGEDAVTYMMTCRLC